MEFLKLVGKQIGIWRSQRFNMGWMFFKESYNIPQSIGMP